MPRRALSRLPARSVLFVCHWHTAPFSSEKKRKQKIRKPTRLEREKSDASRPCETGAPALETTTEAVAPV